MARRTPTPPPTGTCQLAVQHTTCAACGAAPHVAHHAHRTIRRLDGIWRLNFVLLRCLNPHCASFRKLCRPEEEGAWALPHGEFGFLARSLLSEAEEELVALIQEVQALVPVPITGVISDGQIGIRRAVAKALPTIPHQLCQYHYLREAAKPLYEADRHAKKDLKALVRNIRPVERLMEGVLTHQQEITPAYMRRLSEEEAHIVQDYCLAVRSALTDDGQPPLCAAGLRLQERLTKITASLQQAMRKGGIIGAWSTRLSGSCVPSSAA